MYFLLFLLDDRRIWTRIRTSDLKIRIQEAQKHTNLRVLKGGEGLFSLLPGVGLEATLQAKVLRPAAHHCLQVLHSCNINQIL
jgi:hypothetical protein